MSGWATPPTWTTGHVVTATEANQYWTDNINFLLSGQSVSRVMRVGSADYTTTGNSFVDVDASNLKLTFNVTTGRAIVICHLAIKADNTASSSAEADIILDSTTRAGDTTHGLIRLTINTTNHAACLIGYWSGLSVASHTFKLQYRNVTSGAVTTILNNAWPIVMQGWEL